MSNLETGASEAFERAWPDLKMPSDATHGAKRKALNSFMAGWNARGACNSDHIVDATKMVADYLRKYNAWRRGKDERTMDEAGIVPAELGRMIDGAVESLEGQAARAHGDAEPALAKYQPCGCVVCTCEDDKQCQGCGARHCGSHPVSEIPNPTYTRPPSAGAPEAITAVLLESIWQDGFDAENIDDRDYCDSLILARIAVEDAPQPPQEGDQ